MMIKQHVRHMQNYMSRHKKHFALIRIFWGLYGIWNIRPSFLPVAQHNSALTACNLFIFGAQVHKGRPLDKFKDGDLNLFFQGHMPLKCKHGIHGNNL